MSEPDTGDRRQRAALRQLVDVMLAEIRADATRASWTPAERAQAEADLDRIMHQVREETFREHAPRGMPNGQRGEDEGGSDRPP